MDLEIPEELLRGWVDKANKQVGKPPSRPTHPARREVEDEIEEEVDDEWALDDGKWVKRSESECFVYGAISVASAVDFCGKRGLDPKDVFVGAAYNYDDIADAILVHHRKKTPEEIEKEKTNRRLEEDEIYNRQLNKYNEDLLEYQTKLDTYRQHLQLTFKPLAPLIAHTLQVEMKNRKIEDAVVSSCWMEPSSGRVGYELVVESKDPNCARRLPRGNIWMGLQIRIK